MRYVSVFGALLLLQACGGSGGGGVTGVAIVDGPVTNATYTDGESALSVGTTPRRQGSVQVEFRDGNSTALRIDTGTAVVPQIDVTNPDVSAFQLARAIAFRSADGSVWIALENLTGDEDLQHLTFGNWATGLGTVSGALGAGAFGDNALLLGDEVPISQVETVTYNGSGLGSYFGPDGNVYQTEFRILVATNFDDVAIVASDLTLEDLSTGARIPFSDLEFAGSGKLEPNRTIFLVVNDENDTGAVYGHFYGPLAEEVGGDFAIGNHRGAFGAKQ